eukprot:Gb_14851 [translate_table: standard]
MVGGLHLLTTMASLASSSLSGCLMVGGLLAFSSPLLSSSFLLLCFFVAASCLLHLPTTLPLLRYLYQFHSPLLTLCSFHVYFLQLFGAKLPVHLPPHSLHG